MEAHFLCVRFFVCQMSKTCNIVLGQNSPFDAVRDDPKLPGDSGEVFISKWSGWWFNFHFKSFSLLDRKKTSWVGRKPRAHPPQGRQ